MHDARRCVSVAKRPSSFGYLTLLVVCLGPACAPPEAGAPAGLPVALVADAGADVTIGLDESVTLDGGASGGVAPYSFAWTPAAGLSDAAIAQPVASPSETTTYQLSVTDAGGATATDDVTVTVAASVPPIADAGEDVTAVDEDGDGSETVTLDGSGSRDPGGTIASYRWLFGDEEIAVGVSPTVSFGLGTRVITLEVTDDDGEIDTDEVRVMINSLTNQSPIAEAGANQSVVDADEDGEAQVVLNGSGSNDPDGTILAYRWFEDGVVIATGVTPTVVLGVGTHTIRLEVTDDAAATATDVVVVTVTPPPNTPPTADAGDDVRVIDEDEDTEDVTLDGSGSSDPDGTIATYRWIENAVEIATGVTPTVAFAVGTHTVTLEVTDDKGAVGADTVVIEVTGPLAAHAGADQAVPINDPAGTGSVTLDGSATGGTGVYTFRWFHKGSEVAQGPNPTIDLPMGTNAVELKVVDDRGAPEESDTVEVTVWVPSQAAGSLPARSSCATLSTGCTTGDPTAKIDVFPLPIILPTQVVSYKDQEVVIRINDFVVATVPDKIVVQGAGGPELIQLQGVVINDDGDAFAWSQDGIVFSTQQDPQIVFQPGRHIIDLKVVEIRIPGVSEVTVHKQITLIVNLDPAEVCADAGDAVFIDPGNSTTLSGLGTTGGDGNARRPGHRRTDRHAECHHGLRADRHRRQR